MNIYKELTEQRIKGEKLELNNLNKEDFYFMYIIERCIKENIANLFDVNKNKIENLRKKWNIKVTQEFMEDSETISKIYETFGRGYKYDYSVYLLKEYMGFPKFNDLFIPFLEVLNDGKIHNIKEFWKLTNINYEISKRELEYCVSEKEPTLFYRASWCIDAMKRAKLISEIEFKEYLITKRGEELLEECKRNKIGEFGLGFLEKKYNDFDKEIKKENTNIVKEEQIESKIKPNEVIEENEKEKIKEQIANLREIEYSAQIDNKKKTNKKENTSKISKTNYIKADQAKANFGRKCEEIIYNYEKEKLRKEGQIKKAEEVIWVSKEIGDGAGYDIESFENINGKYEKIYIEVKGTDKDYNEPFDVTINEVLTSEKLKEHYYIYRIAKANTQNPIFYKIKGSIKEEFELIAIKFKATRRNK